VRLGRMIPHPGDRASAVFRPSQPPPKAGTMRPASDLTPRLRRRPSNVSASALPDVPVPASVGSTPLYLWQQQALAAWAANGYRGTVGAVPGTGKTMGGIAAAIETLELGGKVQILVPTVELLRQWTRQLRSLLPHRVIGELGDGSDGGLYTSDVLVSVVNSARRSQAQRVPPGSLLIADECHRYGSEENAKPLNERFSRRLGISST